MGDEWRPWVRHEDMGTMGARYIGEGGGAVSRLRELLDDYTAIKARCLRDAGRARAKAAIALAEYMLATSTASDLDARDRTNPACPRVDAARRPHPMDEIDFE